MEQTMKMIKKFYKQTLILAFGGAVLFTSFSFKSDFFEIAKQIEIFTTLFKEINIIHVDETSPADLMDTAIKSMLTDLDPYTNFWSFAHPVRSKNWCKDPDRLTSILSPYP